MTETKNKQFRSETVHLDGQFFINCTFENCRLIFAGGRCEWENTTFSGCRIVLYGFANNTVQVLQGLGFKTTQPIEPEFSASGDSAHVMTGD